MKTALVTTTINVPEVLKLYRACSPSSYSDTKFFITGDRKTPDDAVANFLHDIPNHVYYGADWQSKLGYACSALLGWNTIGRRSIAILEAVKWGADIIVSIDDDNLPMSTKYFQEYQSVFDVPFSGVSVHGFKGWFDVGRLLDPQAPHRGFPFGMESLWCAQSRVNANIGVAAGMCLGNPDVAAVTRMPKELLVHGVWEVLREGGIVVEPDTWTVFNSQNIAVRRELAPCFLMVPQFGRGDDILASMIAQRVMRELDMFVHFGRPMIFQERNKHDLLRDLHAELFVMENVVKFGDWLNGFEFPVGSSPLDMVRMIYTVMNTLSWMPAGVSNLGVAWCNDCERVL